MMTNDGSQFLEVLLVRLDKLTKALELKGFPAMWSTEQIANWMGLSETTVAGRVVTRLGFPQPVVPTGSREAQKRWFADEVIEWARVNRGTLPDGRAGLRKGGRPRAVA
jgi:hypothetical protein